MTTPPAGQADPTQIRVHEHPHALVELTGPTEAAVLRKAAEWLESFDGAVVLLATNWLGDVGELSGTDASLYKMNLTVDMSIAAHEGRWPRDWFNNTGSR
jgi:hypothetical protein